MAVRRPQPPDRAAQRLVPDRAPAPDGPADARLRADHGPLVPLRAARAQVGARAVPGLANAVLTSGGDAPGMNAVIAGVQEADGNARAVEGGFRGLAEGRVVALDADRARSHAGTAGTWLRLEPLRRAAASPSVSEACRRSARARRESEALVVAGGNGSLEAARRLSGRGDRGRVRPGDDRQRRRGHGPLDRPRLRAAPTPSA